MRSPLAGLTTRGRCSIAAGVACGACSVVLDERDLLRVGALLVALPVLTAVLCALSLPRLTIARSSGTRPPSVGDAVQVELQMQARSRTPNAGLLVHDEVPPDCGAATSYIIGGLRVAERATVVYPLTPRVRGEHMLGPLRVSLADPLGLVELVRTVGDRSPMLVRPRVEAFDGPDNRGVAGTNDRASNDSSAPRATGQMIHDAQLREYASGDDIRTIHWRSSARRGELIVRTAERGNTTGTVLVLDTRRSAHAGAGPRSSFEQAVSLTASIAAHLTRLGTQVRVLTTNGVEIANGEAGLDQLALLTTDARTDLGAVSGLVGTEELLAVFGTVDISAAVNLLEGQSRPARMVHLLPSSGSAVLRAAGWRVAAPETGVTGALPSMRQLWSTLQRGGVGSR